jgi:hypothetical protein
MYECGPSIRAAFVPKQCCYSAVMASPSTINSMNQFDWRTKTVLIHRTEMKLPKELAKPHKLLVEGRNQTKNELARQRESYKKMVVEDRDAKLRRHFLTTGELLQSLLDDAKVVAPRPPKPLFIPGQSIIQFWAAWFEKAEAPVKQYSKKNRLGWYSGEVVSRDGYESIRYAGILQPEQHLYRTYWWNGRPERVPESFLSARIVSSLLDACLHSNGKLKIQIEHPDPDIHQNFNTSNVNAKPAASVAGSVDVKKRRR